MCSDVTSEKPITCVDIARLTVSEDLGAESGVNVVHVVGSVHHDCHHDDLLGARLIQKCEVRLQLLQMLRSRPTLKIP